MRALIGVNKCPAALNRCSHAALAGRGGLVSKNSRLVSDHAVTVIVSVDGLSRYSSSWVRAIRLSRFLTKKLSSSSEWSDAWLSGVASYIAIRHRLMNLKPFLDKNRNIVDRYDYRFYLGPISSSPLSTLLSSYTSAIITI